MEEKQYVITMLVENEPGVTARVTGLFAGRGYNIETNLRCSHSQPQNVPDYHQYQGRTPPAGPVHEADQTAHQCD